MSHGASVHTTGLSPAEDLAWGAATLAERLGHLRAFPPADAAADEGSLTAWARACALGDRQALSRRLAWDDIDPAVACRALADRAPAPPPPVPAWTAWIPAFVDAARECAASVGTAGWERELEAATSLPAPPFIEAWLPLLRAARLALSTRVHALEARVSGDAVRALERHLVRQCAAVGELAILEEFRAGGQAYDAYVRGLLEGGWGVVLERYPVLARQLAQVVAEWADAVVAFDAHLRQDRALLEATFGADAAHVADLVPGLSDRHALGRSVAMVVFSSGLRLAYKPREVALEAAFSRWLEWLRAEGLTDAPFAPRVVDRGAYGWVEWVAQAGFASRERAADYFRKAGSLACLVHLLGGTDLHSENLVASAGGPVVVDAEMLLQPVIGASHEEAASADEDSAAALRPSCLLPGLLSLVLVDDRGHTFDIGGLQPAAPRATRIARRRWTNLRSDGITFVPERSIAPSLANDVCVGGVVQRPDAFAGEIAAGFEQAYRFLVARRGALLAEDGPIAAFAACPTRVLFRPSDQYGALQYILAAPRYQRRGVDRSLAIETLVRPFSRDLARPALWPLVRDEQRALEALEVPRLTVPAGRRTLLASDGASIEGYIALAGCEAARRRLLAFDDEDLDAQLDDLRAAASPAVRPGRAADGAAGPGAAPTDDVAVLLRAAEEIGFAVLDRLRPDRDGARLAPSCRGRLDLYAGSSGLLLFVSALAGTAPGGPWREGAAGLLNGIRQAAEMPGRLPATLGACSGLGSVAYALTVAGHLLDDESAFDAAREVGRRLAGAAIERDEVLDVTGGSAGAVLALLALDARLPDPQWLDAAARGVERLVATQVRSGSDRGAWPAGADARPRAGFAHGAAGIAYALARWCALRPDAAACEAVRSAWDYERRVFQENGGTWPTTRGDGSRLVMAAWCHGAPGIALARACGRAPIEDDRLAGEIRAAVAATLAAPRSTVDHLCCGNLGRADILLTVGRMVGHAAVAAQGAGLAAAVARQVLADGRHGMRGKLFNRGATTPGFFQGLSGIGYQLLRTAAPERLPSVLAFLPRLGRVR